MRTKVLTAFYIADFEILVARYLEQGWKIGGYAVDGDRQTALMVLDD